MKASVWVVVKKIELKVFKRRNWVLTFFVIYLTSMFFFSIVGDRGLWASYRVWSRCKKVEAQNERLRADVEKLKKNVFLFKTDARTVERYAREELNMHGKNEIQVLFK